MDRNDKSSPRADEQRKHELSGFVQGQPVARRDDEHLQEEIGHLEPGRRPLTAEAVGDEPSIDETFDRSEFARWFRPSELPATVAQIRETAQDEGAPAWVIEALDGLDAGQRYDTIGEVWEAASPTPREEDA